MSGSGLFMVLILFVLSRDFVEFCPVFMKYNCSDARCK